MICLVISFSVYWILEFNWCVVVVLGVVLVVIGFIVIVLFLNFMRFI